MFSLFKVYKMYNLLNNETINNEIVLYCFISGTVILITGYYIKSKLYSTVIETPNSPPTYNLTQEEIHELNETLDSGESTPRNSVTTNSTELQQVDEMLGQLQSQELNNEEITNISQGRIQDIDPILDYVRTQSPYCLSRDECSAIIASLHRRERLSESDKTNLDLSIRNIEQLEEYADHLDQEITWKKEVLITITELIYSNLI